MSENVPKIDLKVKIIIRKALFRMTYLQVLQRLSKFLIN